MHVGFVIAEDRLSHEKLMLNRLCVGLMGEGVQLTRVVPEQIATSSAGEGEARMALAARLESPMRVPFWIKRRRTATLAAALEKSMPDVLYAVGERAWELALALGEAIARPVLLDIWCAGQVRRAPRWRARPALAGFIAPCESLAEMLRQRVERSLVSAVPMGVPVPPEADRSRGPADDRAVGIAILGSGRDVAAYRWMLEGLRRALPDSAAAQVFLELQGRHEHEIWRAANQLHMLGAVSAIGDAPRYRDLLTHCDILLLPESYGEFRSIILEAMALGLPIIANDDPALDILIDGRTARLIKRPSATVWAKEINSVLSDPEQARAMGARARDFVAQYHRSSQQVTKLINTFETTLSGGALRLA